MKYRYGYVATREPEGGFTIHFPGLPGANSQADDADEIQFMADDCLLTLLRSFVIDHEDIPRPTGAIKDAPAAEGTIARVAELAPVAAAKVALYEAMREAGVSNVALARALKCNERAVRRLLDLRHRSHIGSVIAGLRVLGKIVSLDVHNSGRSVGRTEGTVLTRHGL